MQHDLRPQAAGGSAEASGATKDPGRATLTQGMHARGVTGGSGSTKPPPQPAPSPPPDAVDVYSGDRPTAQEEEYGDGHHDPHGKRFERTLRKGEHAHDAPTDQYNKSTVKNDPATHRTASRPGAVVHDKQGGTHGVFNLKKDFVTRYLYVCRDGKNEAVPFDIVNRADLAMDAKGTDHKKRLLLNPAMPQDLYLPGHKHPVKCVLSWLEGQVAAWINVHELDAGKHITAHQITNAVHARAHRWDPSAAGKSPHAIAEHSTRYVFRNDPVGRADHVDRGKGGDHPRVVGKGQTDGDNVPHYLNKDLSKPAFHANGHVMHKKDSNGNDEYLTDKKGVVHHDHPLYEKVTRSVVAICMNLPERNVPPVAIDTAVAGESFFVMDDKSFQREVPVYDNGEDHAKIVQKWVFGHLAMRKGDHLVPDPNRRGWVPFRVLAATGAELEKTKIDPRGDS